ncbi:unnamed protein product, partial [Brenthis ino]
MFGARSTPATGRPGIAVPPGRDRPTLSNSIFVGLAISSSRDPHTRCDRASREDETWRGALSVRRARLRPTALDDRSLSASAGSVGRRRCLSG